MLFYCETNSKSGKIYLLATMKYTWCAYLSPPFIDISRHKSLQFVNTQHSYLVYLWFYKTNNCFGHYITLGYYFLPGAQVYVVFSPIPAISEASHAIIDTNTNEYLPCMKIFVYVELTILQYVTFVVTKRCFSGSVAVQIGLLLQRYWNL